MKLCPQCEKENPSGANHCMYCGTALVEEEQLSEEAKLLKRLKEQEEENRLLKATLEAQLKQQKTQEDTQKPMPIIEPVAPPTMTIIEPRPEKVSVPNYAEQEAEMPEPEQMFAHPFSFSGRIRRLEYGLSCIIYLVWYLVAKAMIENFSVFLIALAPALRFFLAQGTKRCHDRNNSGWYQLFPLYVLWMLFAEGDDDENDYGFPPK
jgi:uncharacterized membrane protein YhaH (DUF805 family)